MHEAAEFLMGHPVWTHEFASEPLWDLMKAKLLEQHPDIPTDTPEGVDETNWEAYRDRLVAELGESRELVKGSEERPADPITTARQMLGPDKPIVAVGPESE